MVRHAASLSRFRHKKISSEPLWHQTKPITPAAITATVQGCVHKYLFDLSGCRVGAAHRHLAYFGGHSERLTVFKFTDDRFLGYRSTSEYAPSGVRGIVGRQYGDVAPPVSVFFPSSIVGYISLRPAQ